MARSRLNDDHKGHAQRRRARAAGVLAVNASGVDPQQNRYSMPGASGHLGGRALSVGAQRHAAVPQVIRPGSCHAMMGL